MSGVVYFVAAPERIKIGYTTKPESRFSQLQARDFEALTMLGSIGGDRKLERHLHGLVREHRLKGEWFKDCPTVRSVVDLAISGGINLPQPDPVVPHSEKIPTINWPSEVEAIAGAFNGNRLQWLSRASQTCGVSLRTIKALYYRELKEPKYSVGVVIVRSADLARRSLAN